MGQWLSVEELRAAVENDLGLPLYFPAHGGVDGRLPPEACCIVRFFFSFVGKYFFYFQLIINYFFLLEYWLFIH